MPPTDPGQITPDWSASPSAVGAIQGAAGNSPSIPGAALGPWSGTPTAASDAQDIGATQVLLSWHVPGGGGNGRRLDLIDDAEDPIVVSVSGSVVTVAYDSGTSHVWSDMIAALDAAGLNNYEYIVQSGGEPLLTDATFILSGGVDGGASPSIPGPIV